MIAEIIQKIRDNAWLFLRRAIKELIGHDDSNDDGLNEERAVMATTLIQISFELSLIAYFLKVDGIHGIVNAKYTNLSEADLITKFENNELLTKTFNSLKKEALDRNLLLCEDDEYLINNFQKIRNKLVHLNYKFDKGELYDLKYELTYFVARVVIPKITEENDKPSEVIARNIGQEDFKKLINFKPYAAEMNKLAEENAKNVYSCVHCDNESLVTDFGAEYCYSCCEDFGLAGFIDCPYCKAERSMIYDALNIDCQSDRTIRGLCLNCQGDDMVYVCKKCGAEVALEGNIGEGRCCPGFCKWDDK